VSGTRPDPTPESTGLLDLYDRALPVVYGYLVSRVGDRSTAEELTSEVFLAAVVAIDRPSGAALDTGWLVGVARHKLVDHWRRREREERKLTAVASLPEADDDPWDARLDVLQARETLARLGPANRLALTLRYLDGLSIPEMARELGRSRHATEALVVRARAAFRRAYDGEEAP
jgi:RNA polymerase sigma-70 factor (ECF subfamily)